MDRYDRHDVVAIRPTPLSPADVVAVARRGARVELTDDSRAAIARARATVEDLVAKSTPVYGLSTGFGALAVRHIPVDRRAALQRSLIRSHAAGLGPPVEDEVVRAMMLLRTRTLAQGLSGVRPEVVDLLMALLNHGITPVVPEHGSLGCSGDLAPLAHVAMALMGEGEVVASGASRPAAEALADAGLHPVELAAKEGLALVNGTDGMLGMLVLACHDLGRLLPAADLTAAMSVEAALGTDRVFAADLAGLRPHPGLATSAANMARLLDRSEIVASHRTGDPRVQDAYSLRCAPQVTGAARDTLAHVEAVAERELAAVIDNPLVLHDGRVESNGNFHGAPLAHACDFLAIVAADVGAMAERRVDRLLDPARSHGLPPFLADDPGVDSGMMIAQYTAAALVAENRRLAVPASVDSIPTSAMQEDHVSMGWAAARKLRTALDNLARILAVELLVAARALDLRRPLHPAPATGAVVAALRQHVDGPGPDRFAAPELAAAERLVRSGSAVAAAEQVIGELP
ncbi:MAG TPA: histidine ammonia-lyase [Acidimicrobiales bacterium]|nr:histidine ammonia-lyase [Acidimicrobiales bacterium]